MASVLSVERLSSVAVCLTLRAAVLWMAIIAAWVPSALAESSSCIEVPPQDESASFRFEPSPGHAALAQQVPPGTSIGSIRVQRFRVFDLDDPEEDNRVYRWANDFHWVTREWVIRDHLLLEEGDSYNLARLMESGRILRELKFIYDARVRPWRWCGDTVDIEVITRDIWTFTPIISLSLSGGTSDYRLGFRDNNFLGTGKQVVLRYDKDDERSGTTVQYSDPALLGSRWRFRLRLSDNDDGHDRALRLVRPFFSIYEHWSAGGALEDQLLEEKTWYRGDKVAEFDHERQYFTAFGGIATDTREHHQVGRWRGGYTYEEHEFSFSDSTIPPPELPDDRTYSYPYIGYESIEDEYISDSNLNYLGRTEDLYVGEQYSWSLGWSAEALDATSDQVYLGAQYGNTLLVDSRQWWLVNTELSGFWTVDESEWENFWWTAESRYARRHTAKWALFSRLRLDYTSGLTLDNQLTLGGDSGLRGYDRNYQVGDRSYAFNIEERYYSDWHPLRLFRVGAAVFFDIGRAWFEGESNGSNGGTLYNAGFGLRLNSSRAEKNSVIHIDLAFPLVKDDDVDDVQFLIRVRDSF
jgi:outer membrane protein assembly factor BamA